MARFVMSSVLGKNVYNERHRTGTSFSEVYSNNSNENNLWQIWDDMQWDDNVIV